MAKTENFQFNMGSLRSQMTLQIHTKRVSRLWYGRRKTEDIPGIIGLSGFINITNRINIGSRQDDPYSDWWMLRIEEKINEVNDHLETLKGQVDEVFASVPSTFTLSNNVNMQPATLPVYAGSHLGFLAIFTLAQYDDIVRKALLANHIGLIYRATFDFWLDEGDHQLRSLFSLVQQYQYSGITRKDILEGNAKAIAAIEKYGEVPADIFNGTKRSRFSPPLRTLINNDSVEDSADDNEEDQPLTVIMPTESELETMGEITEPLEGIPS